MKEGDNSPWGTVDESIELGPEVWFVSTASHGGLRLSGKAKQAVPTTVRRTFINGGEWAEEDLEASIALPFLHAAGLIDNDRFTKSFEELLADAKRITNDFEAYLPAARHLDALKSPNGQTALAAPAGRGASPKETTMCERCCEQETTREAERPPVPEKTRRRADAIIGTWLLAHAGAGLVAAATGAWIPGLLLIGSGMGAWFLFRNLPEPICWIQAVATVTLFEWVLAVSTWW